MPARFDYDVRPNPFRPTEGIGEVVICPYCEKVAVTLDDYDPEAVLTDCDGVEIVDCWAEGDCGNCGERVEYDYDPIGIIEFKEGRPVRT